MDTSGLFRLNLKDVLHSAIIATVTALLLALGSIVSQQNFDLFTVDRAAVGHVLVNSAFVAFVGNMVRALVSDDTGKVFGRL